MLGDTGPLTAAHTRARDFAERELSLDRFSGRLKRALDEVDDVAPPP
jgi:hypothetical protein